MLVTLFGCVNELVVEVQPLLADSGEPDAAQAEVDAASPEPEEDAGPIEPPDAAAPPAAELDAGVPDTRRPDAASEAGAPDAMLDAGDSGPIVVLEAGPGPDAGCKGGPCDAGTPPGPCSGCDGVTLLRATCDSGALDLCWSNPDGTCTRQCPAVKSCSAAKSCDADEYCYFPERDCGASGKPGFCAKRPKSCTNWDSSACGCDGVLYMNGCLANQAGTASADPILSTCK